MKIKILYSHLNVSGTDYKARPSWFSFEKCFENFLKTLKYNNDYEFHVIYDITRGELEQNFVKTWETNSWGIPIHFHKIKGGSMFGAAKEMYRIAKELSDDMEDNDAFYFVENDYLHVDWVDKIKELFATFNLNGVYVSTYDHLDKYMSHVYPDLASRIFVTHSHHWRTTPSTCGTYLVNKKTFLEDYDVHSGLEGDHNKWLHLNEVKDRFVLSPIPALSTHCMQGLLSPTIDWQKINN